MLTHYAYTHCLLGCNSRCVILLPLSLCVSRTDCFLNGPFGCSQLVSVPQHSQTRTISAAHLLLSAHHFSYVQDALLCREVRRRRREWLDLISRPPSSSPLPECFPCDMEDVAFVRITQTCVFHGFSWLSHHLRYCRCLLFLTEMTSARYHHVHQGYADDARLIMEARCRVAIRAPGLQKLALGSLSRPKPQFKPILCRNFPVNNPAYS